MKTIFAFLLVFCALTATQCLDWESCSESTPEWDILTVDIDDQPVIGQEFALNICGLNHYNDVFILENIHLTSGTILDVNYAEDIPISSWDSTPWCFHLTFEIPQTESEILPINVEFQGRNIPQVACLNTNLTLDTSSSRKFLDKFFKSRMVL